MGKKVDAQEADLFTHGLIKQAMEHKAATRNPATNFKMGDIEFQVVLKRFGGHRVLSLVEASLLDRVKSGQQDLNPSEIRVARRLLSKIPGGKAA